MKKAIKILTLSVLLTGGSLILNAQPQPGGDPGPGGQGGTPVGGFVPVGSGLVILMALGASYGAKKVYNLRKKNIIE